VRSGVVLATIFSVTTIACTKDSKPESVDLGPAAMGAATASLDRAVKNEFNPRLLRRFKPVRPDLHDNVPANPAQADLGRMLYFDKRLSKTGTQACNSCHPLDKFGADGNPTSPGAEGQLGGRNSPTTYHAAGYFAQFWDGRASTVEEQAKGPLTNPVEMGLKDGAHVESILKGIPGYAPLFAKAFPQDKQPITYDNVGKAIGMFERGLVTPSRWDAYLKGDKNALTAQEVEGLRIFTNVGCMVCHTGEFVGGTMYEKVGAVEPWPNQADQGRFQVTKSEGDRMMFKVPTLRNIGKTAPYFHDGSAKTLGQAVTMMGKHQLGLDLSQEEVASISAWLESLTGELPLTYIKEPALP